jgi:hypothetical protein
MEKHCATTQDADENEERANARSKDLRGGRSCPGAGRAQARIWTLDIETKPIVARIWRSLFKVNIRLKTDR